MAEWDIEITRNHNLGRQGATKLAETATKRWAASLHLTAISRPYGFDVAGEPRSLASGISGHLEVKETTVSLRLRLPMLMRAMRPIIAKSIGDELSALGLTEVG